VVDVAAAARHQQISEALRPALFLPFWCDPERRAELVVLREAAEPDLVTRILAAGRAVDPRVALLACLAPGSAS
jgi:hypothetical protein